VSQQKKFCIVRSLLKRGCDVHVFPANSKAEDILAINPDGIMLSNGPGDPKDCVETIETIKKLMGKKPMFSNTATGEQTIR